MTDNLVKVMDDKNIVVSSRAVAENFGKRHDKVIRSIEAHIADLKSTTPKVGWFKEATYLDAKGEERKEYIMNRDGFCLLVMSFNNTRDVLQWKVKYINAFNAMEQVIKEHHLEGMVLKQIQDVADLKKQLLDSGILKEYIAPHHFFDHLVARWKEVTKQEKVRNFYDAVGDYAGITVPYSSRINITVKQWLLNHVGLEIMEEFVVGLETGMIVYSEQGYPVCKHGVFANAVEWNKVMREFNNSCAYCGCESPLLAEHIIPQSTLSAAHPEQVDLIGNIVPACKTCNSLKKKQDMDTWYMEQPFYTKARHYRIKEHQRRYEVG